MDGFSILASSPAQFWIVAALSVFLLSVAKSGFGGALASMSVPVMLFVLSPKEALAVLLPMFLITSVGVFFIWYKHCNWRLVGFMCLFALFGQVVGWLVFDHLTDHILKLCIGFVAVATAANYWLNILRAKAEAKTAAWADRHLWKRASVWCSLSGVSSFVSLSGGIPAQIFLLPHRLSKEAFVGSFSVYFMVIDLLKTPLFLELNLLSPESLKVSAMLLPIIPLGVLVGWSLNKRINDRIFYHVSYAFLLILGVKLLFDALTA
jgi:uncharacterized membrane protein YfcA